MNLGAAQVIQGDARHLPLDDDSVDLVVTSPPYFALRSYQDGGEHYSGQLGSEATPAEFVAALLEVTRECVRVLKPSGSLWVNLGDKYVADNRGSGFDVKRGEAKHAPRGPLGYITGGMRQKSLMGIPWRYALACIDDLGLILRAELIWSKPNGLPESVTDRVRRSHETWFHFTLEPRYFSAVDEIREPHQWQPSPGYKGHVAAREVLGQPRHFGTDAGAPGTANPLGKLPGSVWSIPTQPLQVPDHLGVDHFAAFPTEWPRRIIQGWSPAGVCVECGEGRRPVADYTPEYAERRGPGTNWNSWSNKGRPAGEGNGNSRDSGAAVSASRIITGYACACPQPTAPARPAVVLDPFGGTGTTALVAKALGRHAITLDMSADYSRLAEWRTNDRNQLAHVLDIAKAPTPDEHQDDLLTLLDGP